MSNTLPTSGFFDAALHDVLAAHNPPISLRKLATMLSISPSVLSRLHSARLESSTLRKVLEFFASDKDTQARLLTAYLWDEVGRVGINPRDFWARIHAPDTAWLEALPLGVQSTLQLLGDCARREPTIAAALEQLADGWARSWAGAVDRERSVSYSESDQSPAQLRAVAEDILTHQQSAESQPSEPADEGRARKVR
jgi:hypothetical protein